MSYLPDTALGRAMAEVTMNGAGLDWLSWFISRRLVSWGRGELFVTPGSAREWTAFK
jgi:hypothetical protein